jgi:hypothetical protein
MKRKGLKNCKPVILRDEIPLFAFAFIHEIANRLDEALSHPERMAHLGRKRRVGMLLSIAM